MASRLGACAHRVEMGGSCAKECRSNNPCCADVNGWASRPGDLHEVETTKRATSSHSGVIKTVQVAKEACDFEEYGENSSPYFGAEVSILKSLAGQGEPPPPSGCKFTFTTGAVYIGEWKGFLRHGKGKQRWADGAEYAGNWIQNNAAGRGKFTTKEGDIYIGQWLHGMAHGIGKYLSADNTSSYEGEWLADSPHGCGRQVCQDGSEYVGQFQKGEKNGYGVFTQPDGSSFTGMWSGNKVFGKGRFNGASGVKGSGDWREHALHGVGKYCWPDGDVYSGQFQDDFRHGFGIMIWQSGASFKGFWDLGTEVSGQHYSADNTILQVDNRKGKMLT